MSALSGSEYEVLTEEVKKFGLSKMTASRSINGSCPEEIPPIAEYVSAINIYGILLFTLGTTAVLLVLIMFIDTLKYIMKNSSSKVKAHSAIVIGVYPVVSLATYCSSLVPRSHLLAEAATQGVFMVGMYQLFCLFVAYCGGEQELMNKTKPAAINMKVGPCCCYPCCCFPPLQISKSRLRFLRILVLQLPVVQGLVYSTLLVMWAERESLYQINYMYFQPVIIVSIFIGIWGMSMTMQLLKNTLKDYSMFAKFFVLQLVLICAKMQGLGTRILVWFGVLPCNPPITPAVYGNLIYNTLMLAEMVLLGFIARKLYKKDLPDIETPKRLGVITTHISTIGAIVMSEKNNNTAFYINHNMDETEDEPSAPKAVEEKF